MNIHFRHLAELALTLAALVLDVFFIQPASAVRNDGTNFVVHSGWNALVVSLLGLLAFGGSTWLWFRRTRFWDRFFDAWSNRAIQ